MAALARVTDLLLGAGLAVHMPRDADRTAILETLVGMTLIACLALLGRGLVAIH